MRTAILTLILLLRFCETVMSQTIAAIDSIATQRLPKIAITGKQQNVTLVFNDTQPVSLPVSPAENKVIFITDSKSNSSLLKDVLPICTLFLGIFINQFIIRMQDRRRVKRSGERWVAELRGLVNPIQVQVSQLSNILERSENQYEAGGVNISMTLNCEIFKSLDKSEFLKYIQRKQIGHFRLKTRGKLDYAIKISNKTHGLVDSIAQNHETLQEAFKNFWKEWKLQVKSVKQNIQLLSEAFGWYGVELEAELGHDPIDDLRYKPILDLFDKYIEPHMHDGEYNLFYLQQHFFWPLSKILGELRHDVRLRGMNKYTRECVNGIMGIREEKRNWRKTVIKIQKQYTTKVTQLQELIMYIENENKKNKLT